MTARTMAMAVLYGLALTAAAPAASVLIEAETFDAPGGWSLDTQSITSMGSPYLIAHGLGRPVADATTTVTLPEAGTYRVFVRTKDWVARWNAPGAPGRFEVLMNGQPLSETLGTRGAEWFWHSAGTVQVGGRPTDARRQAAEANRPESAVTATLALHDLTGFNGRCDAIYLTTGTEAPPEDNSLLAPWRQEQLGLNAEPTLKNGYDLVVVGGGYSGIGAAIAAARAGCRVALLQDRGVLGGNGSSEVRVWAMGNIRRGKYPRIGEIVEEFCDHATKSPGTFEEFEDAKKEALVRAEKNIDLYLHTHAVRAEMEGVQSPVSSVESQKGNASASALDSGLAALNARRYIAAVEAFDVRTGERFRFEGRLFCDATGHGTIGALAGADWDMTDKGRMGMSNMWAWAEAAEPVSFPQTPWALPLKMADFPYPRDHHGQWFWESGFDQDPLQDAEGIRDHNLRAVFGAFNAMKNGDGAAEHQTAYLTWVAYIGGPRESRRLTGDVLLTQEDIVAKRDFPDGCVPSTWSIDLHYPKQQYAEKFPDNPFISIAEHGSGVDRSYGYPVPYRCFYSRNVENLFMAGRCISVTHEALGTTRVMKTCGMMGEVVGKAASVCIARDCFPRDVYERYWDDLDTLLRLPGKAYRVKVGEEFTIPADALPEAGPYGAPTGRDLKELSGLALDDRDAVRSGSWTEGTGLKGYFGYGYLYAGPGTNSTCTWEMSAPATGMWDVRIAYQPHENRGTSVPVSVTTPRGSVERQVNMTVAAPLPLGLYSIGQFALQQGDLVRVTIGTRGAAGNAHADAVQLAPVE